MNKLLTITFLIITISLNAQSKNEIKLMKYKSEQILNSTQFFDDNDTESKKEHTLYFFSLSHHSCLIISFTTSTDIMFECLSCEPIMSAFVFSKKNGWNIDKKYLKFGSIGSWGKVISKENIKVFPIEEDFLITIETSFEQMGYFTKNIVCFYNVNNKLRQIGTIDIEYDDSGVENPTTTSWKAQYFVMEKENEAPKILLNITGKKENKDFSKTEIYTYNGKVYEIKK